MTRLSASALDRFRTCPKQFLFVDVERAARREEPGPQLVVGNAVHHALERFFGLPAEDRKPEVLERALRSVWPAHRRPTTFASRADEAAWGQTALEMLATFAASFDLTATPLAREQWLSTRLENGIELFGKLDRIDATASGALDIVDYKTGRRPLEDSDLRHESATSVYVALAESAYSLPVERVRFIYVALGQEATWELEREDAEALKAALADLAGEIREASEFLARPGSQCRFCPVALHCPERQQVALADLEPAEEVPF